MDDVAFLLTERACERLVYRYARHLDAYDYDRFMELWADDATWNMLGNEMKGIAAIRAGLDARPNSLLSRHLITNIIVDVETADTASSHCYTLSFRVPDARGQEPGPLEPPTFLIEYRDRFVRHPSRGWLFARRDISTPLARDIASISEGR